MAISDLKTRSGRRGEYAADFARWSEEQARALRERRPSDVDWDNVAEEIETLGRSERREIENRLTVLIAHLLKGQFQPDARSSSWRSTIIEQRGRIGRLLDESPSLRGYPALIVAEEYRYARGHASAETRLPVETFPETCPYSTDEILDEGFLPGEAA